MIRIKNILLSIFLLSVISSCIEYFHPELGNYDSKYVVDGQITNQEGFQTVTISQTSTLKNTKFIPLKFCTVKIIDNHGNEYNLDDIGAGRYQVWMKKENLMPGISYQINIKTPLGVEIVSDFDQMQECPKIDSLYYLRKNYPASEDIMLQGIQFFVDFDRSNTNSKFYRWDIIETWEHHAVYPITWHKGEGGKIVNYPGPDYSRFKCWSTELLKNIFTFSTENVAQNNFKLNALHIVDNQTQRLKYCYSVLVIQHAMSEPAFIYWDKLRASNIDQGGLFYTQPLVIKGNLRCTTNPELEVLGFFSVSAINSKRIIVQNIENFDVPEPSCVPPHLPSPNAFPKENYNYMIDIDGVKYIVDDGCVECDYMGGKTVKPSYWPY